MIVRDAGGSKLVQLDTKGFCLSDHEKAYLKLAEFVNRKSDNRGNPRQFMERHLDLVFQPQLSIIRRAQPFLTLSDKITELEKAQALPAEIAKKLHAYREALNPDHHDDDHDKAVEDARNNTKQMLDVLYLLPT